MSSVGENLFYLPLQSALTAFDMRTINPRDNSEVESDSFVGHWPEFIGDNANSALRCLINTSDFSADFWPLILHGESGNGKTSVAMSFAKRFADQHGLKIVFERAADLVRRYRDSIQTESTEEFRRRLLSADILLIDDLQHLCGKDALQLEIVKILDQFAIQEKRLIATINCIPSTANLIHQFSSRLSSGLVLPVNRPGIEGRRAVIERLCSRFELSVNSEAVEFIAKNCEFSIPRLTQLFAHLANSADMTAENNSVGIASIRSALFGDQKHFDRDFQVILKIVSQHFELPISEIRGKSRKQTTVFARGVSIFLAREFMQISFAKLGEYLNGRDHSTIIHAYNNVIESIGNNPKYEKVTSKLRSKISDLFLQMS